MGYQYYLGKKQTNKQKNTIDKNSDLKNIISTSKMQPISQLCVLQFKDYSGSSGKKKIYTKHFEN